MAEDECWDFEPTHSNLGEGGGEVQPLRVPQSSFGEADWLPYSGEVKRRKLRRRPGATRDQD